ncbi:MAG: glycerophosphodiester phosphodiesterase family protein [Myxococcales bacterium]|nr:glycerophosphodiester phosphodiesterase family protein [Myxococcales bacterium]
MAEGPASEGTSGDPSGTAGGDPSTAGDDTSTEGAAPPDDRLPASAYECGAPGPFVAPPRPYRGLCHLDPACRSPLVVAHRIAPAFAPENSLAALRAAILLGVDVAESDIRVTADGHAVLLHDASVDRTTDGHGEVAAMTLVELQALRLRPQPGHPAGDFSCERVPTLAEAIAVAGDQIALELEVKTSAAGVAAALLLDELDLVGAVYLRCEPAECAALRAAVPDAPIMTVPVGGAALGSVDDLPPPRVVRVEPLTFAAADLEAIAAIGARSSRSALDDVDPLVLGGAEPTLYLDLYGEGLDMLLTDAPHLVLDALGRGI